MGTHAEQKMLLVLLSLENYKGFGSSVPETEGKDHYICFFLSHSGVLEKAMPTSFVLVEMWLRFLGCSVLFSQVGRRASN